jgi:RecB family exonuclease
MAEERKHSVLAPSSKEWIHCGFSAKFLANKEEETNDASEFGTECHALAEAYIRKSLGIEDFDGEPVGIEELKSRFAHFDEEMEALATGYADFVISQADYEEKRSGKKPIVFVEQLLEIDYAPDTHGTADAIIIAGDTLTIIDNKTGFIPVHVFEEDGSLNSQLGIYGLYAYKLFEDIYPIKKIRLVIYQERIHNVDDKTLDVEDLLEWEVAVLRPAAKEAQNPNAEAVSGKWCKYCPGKTLCRQRSEDALSIDIEKKPELMTDEEIEAILPRLDFVIDYCNSVKEYALKKAIDGKKWKGYVLSETVTKRKISDEEAVKRILKEAGYCPEVSKLMSISELQKLVGKARFNDLVGNYVIKPKGQPVLIKEETNKEDNPNVEN